MNPMEIAVNSLFNKLGKMATYKNKIIRLILTKPDEIVGIGFVQTHSPTHQAKIKIFDAPNLKIGDKIEIDADIYSVHSEPIKDIHNLIWSVDLICV